jgi:hypothetical protein
MPAHVGQRAAGQLAAMITHLTAPGARQAGAVLLLIGQLARHQHLVRPHGGAVPAGLDRRLAGGLGLRRQWRRERQRQRIGATGQDGGRGHQGADLQWREGWRRQRGNREYMGHCFACQG